jgi:hypothetical protein
MEISEDQSKPLHMSVSEDLNLTFYSISPYNLAVLHIYK